MQFQSRVRHCVCDVHGQDVKARLGRESVHFGDLRIASLLFADDVVLLASSDLDV